MIVIQNTASQTPSPSFQLHGACLETEAVRGEGNAVCQINKHVHKPFQHLL